MKLIDLYRGGPPPSSNWLREPEEASTPTAATAQGAQSECERDRLVTITAFQAQTFQEDSQNPNSGLFCLWRSNRLCILVFSNWKVYDQMLLDDTASLRTRLDIPLCAALLPGRGGCGVVVSYASMIIRWWQVSLHKSIQQACLVLNSPLTHLAALSASSANTPSWAGAQPSATRPSARREDPLSSSSLSHPESRSLSGLSQQSGDIRSSGADDLGELFVGLTESAAHILLAGMDGSRDVSLFVGCGSDITRVYTVDKTWGAAIVDGIWLMDTHIALLLRSGDVRHIEFDINGELMQLADLFADAG